MKTRGWTGVGNLHDISPAHLRFRTSARDKTGRVIKKQEEPDVSNPDHACPEWDPGSEWDSKRRPERNEPCPSTFFPFEFRHGLCLFSVPLPPFVILHLFSFFQRGLKKRSGGRETRELAFRGTYGYLFSRRRKYPALFFSLHPLYSSSIPLLSHSLGIRMVCRFDLAKKRAPFRSRNKIHRSLFASFQKTARLTKVSAMEISKFSPYTCWSIKLICQSKSDCFCNFY